MKKILLFLFIALLLFAGYILLNTFTFSSKQTVVEAIPKEAIPYTAGEHLAAAISIPTISYENPEDFDSLPFYRFREFLKTTYPLADSLLTVTYINEFSFLYKWPGTNPELKPVLLLGHSDVVPVPEENLKDWSVSPFGGEIKNGIIWGRGAIDDKNNVIGILEAAELLLKKGFKPERTFYFCFGHDEEIGGYNGAMAMSNHLKAQGVEAEFVLDEGYAITQGMIPGIEKDVALIGTAEKGFVSFELTVDMEGGHSSMPKKETAIDVVSAAVVKLKKAPFPAEITQPLSDFMDYAGPEMPFMQKMAFANPNIFKGMIFSTYGAEPSGNALIRTTTSPTIIQGGVKDNVIPYRAKALINFRTLPGTSSNDVRERIIKVIEDDRITVKKSSQSNEPSASSDISSFGYETIDKTIKEIFPNTLTAPNLVIGATDARHYYQLSDHVYRFTPFYLNKDNINTFHGVNERIPVDDFYSVIRFYMQLIKNTSK